MRFASLACLATLAGLLPAGDPPPAALPPIGLVDMDRVFEEARFIGQRSETLGKQGDEAKAKLAALAKEAKDIETLRATYPSSDPKFAEYTEDLEVLNLRLRLRDKATKDAMARRRLQILKEVHLEVRRQLAGFARDKGIQIVFLARDVQKMTETTDRDPMETMLSLSTLPVWYSDPRLDVTQAFIEYANAKTPADPPANKPVEKPDESPGTGKQPTSPIIEIPAKPEEKR